MLHVAVWVGVVAFVAALVAMPQMGGSGVRGSGVAGFGGEDGGVWRAERSRVRATDQLCEPSIGVVWLMERFGGNDRWDALAWGELGWVFESSGMGDSARRAWGEGRARMERVVTIDGGTATDWYNLACLRALCGAEDRALSALRRAVLLGWVDGEYARGDRDLAGLRGLAGFEEALRLDRREE